MRARAACAITVCAWIALLFTPSQSRTGLWADHHAALTMLQIGYAMMSGAALIVWRIDRRLRARLRAELCAGQPLVVFLAGAVSITGMALLFPDPHARLLHPPFPLIVVGIHTTLIALLIADTVYTPFSSRARRYAWIVASLCSVALIVAHLTSTGAYMALDTPDEAELGSLAVSTARTGSLDRTYIGSAFGTPDPAAARYYALMGVWLRWSAPNGAIPQFERMRAFALMIGVGMVALTAWALWRMEGRRAYGVMVGIGVLLAFSAFTRGAHSIRQDIGFGAAAALALYGLIAWHERGQMRGLAWIAAGFYIGMETIPTAALVSFAVVGVGVIARPYPTHIRIRAAIWLGVLFCVGVVAYLGVRLVGDETAWARLQAYAAYYGSLGNFTGELGTTAVYYLRFNLALAPLEGIVVIGAFIAAWRLSMGRAQGGRWIIGSGVGSMAAIILTIGGAYGYLVWIAPFAAFAAARAISQPRIAWIAAFIVLPSLVIVPLRDMNAAIIADSGRRELAEADLLTWRIPPGVTAIGEDVFWFTLADQRDFVGWSGIRAYAAARALSFDDAVRALDPAFMICLDPCAMLSAELRTRFAPPFAFTITRGTYWVYPAA